MCNIGRLEKKLRLHLGQGHSKAQSVRLFSIAFFSGGSAFLVLLVLACSLESLVVPTAFRAPYAIFDESTCRRKLETPEEATLSEELPYQRISSNPRLNRGGRRCANPADKYMTLPDMVWRVSNSEVSQIWRTPISALCLILIWPPPRFDRQGVHLNSVS